MQKELELFTNDKSINWYDKEKQIAQFIRDFELESSKYNKDNVLILYMTGPVFVKNDDGDIIFYECIYEPQGYARLGNTYVFYGHETIYIFNADTGESLKDYTR